jgi:hypothetical protein
MASCMDSFTGVFGMTGQVVGEAKSNKFFANVVDRQTACSQVSGSGSGSCSIVLRAFRARICFKNGFL